MDTGAESYLAEQLSPPLAAACARLLNRYAFFSWRFTFTFSSEPTPVAVANALSHV